MPGRRILLIEPWLGGSHGQWGRGYRAASAHDVSIVGLTADRWRWRLRGGAAPLASAIRAHVERFGRPDLAVVSSPVDVARLLGLTRRVLEGVPVAVYQHESQLLYPNPKGSAANDLDALHDWFAWMAADAVFFNSDWHRRSVVDALPAFVDRFPDDDHAAMLDDVVARFETLPLGLDLSWCAKRRVAAGARSAARPLIVWPHRWENDKNPLVFARALDKLVDAGLEFDVVLAGASGPAGIDGSPGHAVRRLIADRHGERVVASGPFTVRDYRTWLTRADVVVSCASHDFFGVGVAEAVGAGCLPVVPDALNYPDLLGAEGARFLYPAGRFGTRLVEVVGEIEPWRRAAVRLGEAMARFDWSELAPRYDACFEQLMRSRPVKSRGRSPS